MASRARRLAELERKLAARPTTDTDPNWIWAAQRQYLRRQLLGFTVMRASGHRGASSKLYRVLLRQLRRQQHLREYERRIPYRPFLADEPVFALVDVERDTQEELATRMSGDDWQRYYRATLTLQAIAYEGYGIGGLHDLFGDYDRLADALPPDAVEIAETERRMQQWRKTQANLADLLADPRSAHYIKKVLNVPRIAP